MAVGRVKYCLKPDADCGKVTAGCMTTKEGCMAENCRFTNEEKGETYYILDNKLYYTDQEFVQALMRKYNLSYVHQHEIMKEKACRLATKEEFAQQLRMFVGKEDLQRFERTGELSKRTTVSSSRSKKKR